MTSASQLVVKRLKLIEEWLKGSFFCHDTYTIKSVLNLYSVLKINLGKQASPKPDGPPTASPRPDGLPSASPQQDGPQPASPDNKMPHTHLPRQDDKPQPNPMERMALKWQVARNKQYKNHHPPTPH